MNDAVRRIFSEAVELREKGRTTAAIELLEKLAEFAEESAIFFATLGQSYSDIGKLPEAIVAFKKATRLDPYSELYSLGLFHSLWQEERKHEALEETKRFMKLSDSEDYRKIISEINDSEGHSRK